MTAAIFKQTLATALISGALMSSAYALSPENKEHAFDLAYEQLIANPSDLDLTVTYAELAVELGDYEAAIAPLERLLVHNPDVPKVKLELGILYYLLGSYDAAKTYLTDAKASAVNEPDIAAQADSYLAKL